MKSLRLAAILAAICVAADSAAPLPSGAVAPMRRYSQAVAAADLERDRVIERARLVLIHDLKLAQRDALGSGKEADALTIAQLIQANDAAPKAADGRWEIQFNNTNKRVYVIRGAAIRAELDGHTMNGIVEEAPANAYLIKFDKNTSELGRITPLADGRALVEIFAPPFDLSRAPACFGIGYRGKQGS